MIGPITGIISSNVSVVREYFTTILYPFAVNDDMSISNPAFSGNGSLWQIPMETASIGNPSILSGSLVASIVYVNYTNGAIENTSIENPIILSGSLVASIVYKTYEETEPMSIANAEILSGSLVTTIAYINYTNGAIENTSIDNPTILSGTLL